jgi:hypothetical protein
MNSPSEEMSLMEKITVNIYYIAEALQSTMDGGNNI